MPKADELNLGNSSVAQITLDVFARFLALQFVASNKNNRIKDSIEDYWSKKSDRSLLVEDGSFDVNIATDLELSIKTNPVYQDWFARRDDFFKKRRQQEKSFDEQILIAHKSWHESKYPGQIINLCSNDTFSNGELSTQFVVGKDLGNIDFSCVSIDGAIFISCDFRNATFGNTNFVYFLQDGSGLNNIESTIWRNTTQNGLFLSKYTGSIGTQHWQKVKQLTDDHFKHKQLTIQQKELLNQEIKNLETTLTNLGLFGYECLKFRSVF